MMAQDTRKDPRAKVLTMTVRYKSATVDEFIEHHSHDVSRGGIFIKTPSPFLAGTLLKFEIRIADDKAMLQGVGRVVWKRDTAGTGPEKPAGMGVKFIKVDEASRNLIDRLIISKGGGVSAYDAEAPAEPGTPLAASASAQSPRGAAPVSRLPSAPAPAAGRPPVPIGSMPLRKGTMIGLGVDAIAAAAAAAAQAAPRPQSQAPRPTADPMFPRTNSEGDMPPAEERTVMKQAAQLLEEALKGAGGSMDELGSGEVAPAQAVAEQAPRTMPARHAEPAAHQDRRPAPSPAHREPAARPARPVDARPVAAGPALVEPAARKKGSGGRVMVSLLLVAAAAAGAYGLWQKNQASPPPEPMAAPPPVVTAAPTPTPVVPAPPPVETAAPVESAAPPASAAASSGKANGPPIQTAPLVAKPPPVEKPAPVEKPIVEKPAPVERPAPVARPKPKPEEGAAPPAEKKPKPAPKPADDNPY
jgi:uncharacterized protein (TIGR02266 family)